MSRLEFLFDHLYVMKDGVLGIVIAIGGSLLTASGYTLQKIAHKRAEKSLAASLHARRRSEPPRTPGDQGRLAQDAVVAGNSQGVLQSQTQAAADSELLEAQVGPGASASHRDAGVPASPPSVSYGRTGSAPTPASSPVTVMEIASPISDSTAQPEAGVKSRSAADAPAAVPHEVGADHDGAGTDATAVPRQQSHLTSASSHLHAESSTGSGTAAPIRGNAVRDCDSEATATRASGLGGCRRNESGAVIITTGPPSHTDRTAKLDVDAADLAVAVAGAKIAAVLGAVSLSKSGPPTPSPPELEATGSSASLPSQASVAGLAPQSTADAVRQSLQPEVAPVVPAVSLAEPATPQATLAVPYWRFWQLWAGLLLLLVGSIVSVVTYGLASQAQLAPMSALTLLFNEVLAWLVLKERLGRVDFVACALMAAGVTVALVFQRSADKDFESVEAIGALLDRPIVYAWVGCVAAAIIIMSVLVGRWGRWPVSQLRPITAAADAFCRSAVAGLLGGFTGFLVGALAGIVFPAVGRGEWSVFGSWAIWAAIALCVAVAVNQVRFMNAGLSRYDSNRIIPIYQSALVLAGVASGLILWNDAAVQTALSASTFAGGCAINVCGVALLALKPRHAAAATAPTPTPAAVVLPPAPAAAETHAGEQVGIELTGTRPASPHAERDALAALAAAAAGGDDRASRPAETRGADLGAPWPEPAPRNSATGALIEALEVAVAAAAGTALDPDLTQATLDAAEPQSAEAGGCEASAATPSREAAADQTCTANGCSGCSGCSAALREPVTHNRLDDRVRLPGGVRRRHPGALSPVREPRVAAAVTGDSASTPRSTDSSPRFSTGKHASGSVETVPLTRSAAQGGRQAAQALIPITTPATAAARLFHKAADAGAMAASRLVRSVRHGVPADGAGPQPAGQAGQAGGGGGHRRVHTWAGQNAL